MLSNQIPTKVIAWLDLVAAAEGPSALRGHEARTEARQTTWQPGAPPSPTSGPSRPSRSQTRPKSNREVAKHPGRPRRNSAQPNALLLISWSPTFPLLERQCAGRRVIAVSARTSFSGCGQHEATKHTCCSRVCREQGPQKAKSEDNRAIRIFGA
jgi:hypothetical protein